MNELELNTRGLARSRRLLDEAVLHRVHATPNESGAQIVDCGVNAVGGLQAGRAIAEVCLAGLGTVSFHPGSDERPWPKVCVACDHPVAACMASQYAGWPVAGDDFFAMASGPMRCARGKEPLFENIGYLERPAEVIGVLETGTLPSESVCAEMATECGVSGAGLTLLVAPTASMAGTVQVVARSLETALHKMYEIGFDISCCERGFGVAPMPPMAANDLAAIGRTNDAVLYGAEVTLWFHTDDELLQRIGPQIPSSASRDYGQPFSEVFERYDRDFYKIDPLLFSPAVVTLINSATGRSFRFGEIAAEVLRQSFGE